MVKDIFLFIPRLVRDIALMIWGAITAVWDLICRLFGVIDPTQGGPDGWIKFIGIIVWIVLATSLRKEFGGILKSMFYMALAVIAALLMWALNPIGLIITLVLIGLIGFGVIHEHQSWVYMVLGLMWAIIILTKVMA